MRRTMLNCCALALLFAVPASRADGFETDIFDTSEGRSLVITFIGHGTLMFEWGEKVIHVDPVGRYADYSGLPSADLVLITHEHGDHLDPEALVKIRKEGTVILANPASAATIDGSIPLENGESRTELGIHVETTPAYNILHKRDSGEPFHPKGRGNGYVLTFGDKRVYVAGDTENIPEMKALEDIDIAFLPMNLPYTMTPEMVADAARAFRPKVLYPYHYGNTDTARLAELLKDEVGIDLRIRDLR